MKKSPFLVAIASTLMLVASSVFAKSVDTFDDGYATQLSDSFNLQSEPAFKVGWQSVAKKSYLYAVDSSPALNEIIAAADLEFVQFEPKGDGLVASVTDLGEPDHTLSAAQKVINKHSSQMEYG